MATKTYSGSCHCGAVRFEADLDLAEGTIRCNCSVCRKARAWFVTVPLDRVRIHAAPDAQTEYQWLAPGKPRPYLHYRFCKTCGIRAVGRGGDEGDPRGFWFVNVAALDVDPAELAAAPVRFVDGRHDRYDRAPEDTRAL